MQIDWHELFGRLHPLVVHFPIALVMVAALSEILGWVKKRPLSSETLSTLLGFATIFAIAAAATGWWFARQQENADGPLLFWHRWLGLAVAAATGAAWGSLRVASYHRYRPWLLLLAAALVALCGHLGGLLVWHKDFFQ
jgi:uncharacterized membrane protein